MVKHNNVIPNQHFRKEWAVRVSTWLDQPKAKERRRKARQAKAAAVAPRPVDKLRPAVRCQTVRYNTRVRAGRGFSLEELKKAGVTAKTAATIGISVDHRRRNKSTAGLEENAARIGAYVAKLAVQPRKSGTKKVHAAAHEVSGAEFKKFTERAPGAKADSHTAAAAQSVAAAFPIKTPAAKIEFAEITAAVRDESGKRTAFKTLRQERTNAKLDGRRKKKAAAAAAAPAAGPAPAE